jgi:hypothetical protein
MTLNYRKHKSKPKHEYSVLWDQDRLRFNVLRDGRPSGVFSGAQRTAIGFAVRDAQIETAVTGAKIIVTCQRDGIYRIEWDSTVSRHHYP